MLVFPRYIKRDTEDYSDITVEINKDDSSKIVTYDGKEVADKLDFVPDPEKNGYTIVQKDITESFYISMFNPYDSQNVGDDESYFLLLVNSDGGEVKIKSIFKRKDFSDKYDTEEKKYIYVTAKGDWEKTYMIQRSSPKPFGMYFMVHTCSFKDSKSHDKFTLAYFTDKNLYTKELTTEYQAFKLTNDYYDEDFQIFKNNEESEHGDFIVNYYLFKDKKSFLTLPGPIEMNKKIWFLKSRNFIFELNGYKLEWYANLNVHDSSAKVEVQSTSYLVCILEDTLYNNAYAGNECYIQKSIDEGKIECHTESSSFTTLSEGLSKSVVVVYEEDDMYVKLRYPIGVFLYGGKDEDEEGEKKEEEKKVGKFNELLKTQSFVYSEKSKSYFYCNFTKTEGIKELIIHAQTSNIDGYLSEGNLKIVVLATNKEATEDIFTKALNDDAVESRLYQPKLHAYNNLVFTAIIVDKPYTSQFEYTYVIFSAENIGETFRFYKIGDIKQYTIKDNQMKSVNIDCQSLGTPIYINFNVPDENFKEDKKGIVLLTDAVEKNAGSFSAYAGLPSENKDEKFQPFINSKLSAFKFRNNDGDRECNSVTVIFIPLLKNEIAYVHIQTTDEGIVIHREERLNRIFKVEMFTGYDKPFYMIGTYNYGADAYLYLEQVKGLFEVDFIDYDTKTHILPLETDTHFQPLQDTFTRLHSKFDIFHIKQVYPGRANLYYSTVYEENELIITEFNSETNLVVKYGETLKVQIPAPEEKGVTIYLKVKSLVSKSTEPTKIKIDCVGKEYDISPKEEKYIDFTPTEIINNPTINFTSPDETILTLTLVYGDIWKIIEKETGGLTNRYLLYKFPKDDSVSSYVVQLENEDPLFFYQATGAFVLAKDTKYIPDPNYGIDKAVIETTSESQAYAIIMNPYDQFGTNSEDEYYYYAISYTYPTENINPYKFNVRPNKKMTNVTKVEQNIHYLYKNTDKNEIFKMDSKKENEIPQGLTIFVYTCNFKENSKNILSLYYDNYKVDEKELTYAYFIHNTQNTFNGMNMRFSSESITKYDFIVSYLYTDKYETLDKIDYYRKKMSALESERYAFYFDENTRELSWYCVNCISDASGKFSENVQYMICKINPGQLALEDYENQCKLQELIQKNQITCATQKESDEVDFINLETQDLSKVILFYKISENPVLMRNFMGFYRYNPEEEEEQEDDTVGEFNSIKIGKKYNVTKGKYYLQISSYDLWELNTGIISVFAPNIGYDEVKGGFGTFYEQKTSELLQGILDNGNIAIQPGEITFFKEKISHIVYMRESTEDSDYYLVLEFNFEKMTEIYVNAPFKVLTLQDNKFKSYTIEFKEAYTTSFIRVNINADNFMSDKKGLFIYIDDVEQDVGSHEVFLTSVLKPDDLKSNYPLTAYKFRKYTDEETGESHPDHDYALIRLYCTKPRTKIHVRIQTTDEGIVVLQDRKSRQFTVGFTYDYNSDFYLVTTNKNLGEEYAVYIQQESGKFSINAITDASVSHILPGKNDLIFEPKEGHYLKIDKYFCIMHISLKQYGTAMFHFILSPNDLNILENSVNTIIVRDSKTIQLPVVSGNTYNIKAELISGKNGIIDDIVFTKEKPYRKLKFEGKQVKITTDEERIIVRLTVITNENLYPEVIEESKGGLTSQFLLIRYPRPTKNNPYTSISIAIQPEEESSEKSNYGLIQIIEGEKSFVPDPLNSGIYQFRGEELTNYLFLSQPNPYDQYSIPKDEYYYMAIHFNDKNVPKYKIEITTESEEKSGGIIYAPPNTIKKIPYSTQETFSLNMEREELKSKYVLIFAHSCNYDSKAEESGLIGISYFQTEILWGSTLSREYEAFTISNEYSNMNIVVLPGKSTTQMENSDFLLSYYYSNTVEGISTDKLNLKIDKLRSLKFPLQRRSNKITWELDTSESDKGEDGTGIQTKNRQYIVCQVSKRELRDRRKNYFNSCYFNDKYTSKQISCNTIYEQYISENGLDLRNNALVIYQEMEIPIKIRMFLGIFDSDIQIDNDDLRPRDGDDGTGGGSTKKVDEVNKTPYILLMIFFGVCILIIGIVTVKIYLEMKQADASNSENAVPMTLNNVNDEVNQINDDPDDNIVK